MTIAEYALLGLLVLRMLFAGFSGSPGRFLSWPMFAYGGAVRVDGWIEDFAGTVRPMRLCDYSMPGDIVFDKLESLELVRWLADRHRRVWGTISVYDEDGLREIPFDTAAQSAS